ncbi:MAG TPA: peptide ABC transporter substrate-binding protein [Candidatus Dormibacteraeota bacterium]|nr:peptide ABC transporter substrate-binding protein [Candidatus Dormibacteraeota bacterium]
MILSRRLICAFAVLLVACAACDTGVTVAPKLAKDQVLRLELEDQPSTLDPGQTDPTHLYETGVLRTISEPLLKPLPDLSGVMPAAAQSYEVNGDGTAYVFHLRTNAKYWDGAPVKAADFVYAWQRLIDPRLAAPNETLFADAVLNGERVSLLDPQRDAASIDSALNTLGLKAVDDFTFQVQLARPDPAFVWLAALPAAAPVRKDVVTQNGDKWATSASTLMTNGPFKVSEMVKNDHITVVPNPHYWGAKPTLTRIDYVIVNDGAVALTKYRSGELDEIRVDLPQSAGVSSDDTLKRQLVKTPDLTVFWIAFRVNSPPLDNVHLRQAIAQAIDRKAFVNQVLAGQGLAATALIPRGMHGYDPNLTTQSFDVAQARASLAASGLSAKQVSLTLSYDQSNDFRKKAAQFVHDQLVTNLGVNVVLQGLDPNTLGSNTDNGQFQVTGPEGWTADYPDQADWYDTFLTTSSYNISLWQNSQYDNFVRVARTDTDPSRRDQEYLQAQSMLVSDAPVAFVAQTVSWYLVQPYVRGVTTSPLDEWPGALEPGQVAIAPH